MELIDSEYMLIDDINKLGKFEVHYGSSSDHPRESCLRPILTIKKKHSRSFLLEPGFLSADKKFYQSPLSIFYVQFNYIEVHYVKKGRFDEYPYLDIHLQVFSKDFSSQREIHLSFSSGSAITSSSRPIPINLMNAQPMDLNPIINNINVYIEWGNELDLLNEAVFNGPFHRPRELEPHQIMRDINKLTFKYYTNDYRRPGKENRFFSEVEITNLPQNDYLVQLYKNIIQGARLVHQIEYSNNMLFAIYDGEYFPSPCKGRKERVDNGIRMGGRIKDALKYEIRESIDLVQEKNERMKKNSPATS